MKWLKGRSGGEWTRLQVLHLFPRRIGTQKSMIYGAVIQQIIAREEVASTRHFVWYAFSSTKFIDLQKLDLTTMHTAVWRSWAMAWSTAHSLLVSQAQGHKLCFGFISDVTGSKSTWKMIKEYAPISSLQKIVEEIFAKQDFFCHYRISVTVCGVPTREHQRLLNGPVLIEAGSS